MGMVESALRTCPLSQDVYRRFLSSQLVSAHLCCLRHPISSIINRFISVSQSINRYQIASRKKAIDSRTRLPLSSRQKKGQERVSGMPTFVLHPVFLAFGSKAKNTT